MTPLTQEQAIVLTGFTGVLCLESFSDFHADVNRRAGRPVFTHEMADLGWIRELYRDDFMALVPEQAKEAREE